MCICYICSFVVIIVNYLHDLVFFSLSLYMHKENNFLVKFFDRKSNINKIT